MRDPDDDAYCDLCDKRLRPGDEQDGCCAECLEELDEAKAADDERCDCARLPYAQRELPTQPYIQEVN